MLSIFENDLFIAQPIPSGYSWTLASRLGQMLKMAEAEYGKRDKSWTILGVEFVHDGPRVWFPGNCNHVVVQLGTAAAQDGQKAMFQLAHEVVHLLDPSSAKTTVLEEGIATNFALSFMAKEMGNPSYKTGDQKYGNAATLVGTLLAAKNDAPKLLRQSFGPFHGITEKQILQTCPSLPPSVANQLAAQF